MKNGFDLTEPLREIEENGYEAHPICYSISSGRKT